MRKVDKMKSNFRLDERIGITITITETIITTMNEPKTSESGRIRVRSP